MFVNPLMLAGVAGAVVPLVLHLLSRARYRSVDWGAMMFLADADARQRESHRLKQLILLLVRMSIVALLALAMARPAISSSLGGLTGGGHATAAIVLDVSASMSYDDNGRTRLDSARDVVKQVLSTLNRGDRAVLLLAGSPQADVQPTPTTDLQSVAERVNEVKPTAGEADMADALTRAMEVLDRNERLNREIYVISDKQAVSWRHVDASFAAAWNHRAGIPPHITVILVGGEEADNVAVESIELLNPPAIRDQPAEVEVKLHNYGSTPRPSVPVSLLTGNHALADTTITLPSRSSAAVRASARFNQIGSHVLTATAKLGALSNDHLDAAVDVTDPLRVLIISGESIDPGYRGQASLLQLSLAPFKTTGHTGADPAVVDLITPEKWPGIEFDHYDVVVLCNLERFTQQQARDLEQFVYGGGGLLIAPGTVSRADDYNAALYRNGAGIMPALLQPPTTVDGSATTSVLGLDLSHPIFRFLRGRPDPVPSSAIVRYFPATPRQPDARVLASYASGKPFLIEGASGRGRVLLVTTSLDADWTTLPLSSFYLPFAQSAVRFLANGGSENRNLSPGEALVTQFDDVIEDNSAWLELPDHRHEPAIVSRIENRSEFRYTHAITPGIYRLHYRAGGKDHTTHFVVSSPREESDLTPLSSDARDTISKALKCELLDSRAGGMGAVLSHERTGQELWGLLLAGVLVLAVLEMMLTRWWTGGPS